VTASRIAPARHAGTGTPPLRTLEMTALVGNPRPGSRTLGVARHAVNLLHQRLLARGVPLNTPALVDLSKHGADLVVWGAPTARLEPVVAAVRRADLLVVASPTFKASYSGLLKLFLDTLPRGELAGTVAVPLMTAASAAHRFAVDSYLRPLLVELGATVPAPGISILEDEFDRLDSVLDRWGGHGIPVLDAMLTAMPAT
jgi:FMN reductase